MRQVDKLEDAPWSDIAYENDKMIVYRDAVPVTQGHLLFVPREPSHYHILECFNEAMKQGNKMKYAGECEGYNIGLNHGEAAGQTIDWPHVHMIPRRKGDMDDPRGGVRHVIPDRGNYKTSPHYKDINLN